MKIQVKDMTIKDLDCTTMLDAYDYTNVCK